jgi:hypothetical protein
MTLRSKRRGDRKAELKGTTTQTASRQGHQTTVDNREQVGYRARDIRKIKRLTASQEM